jgi:hypothetical protein
MLSGRRARTDRAMRPGVNGAQLSRDSWHGAVAT